MGSPSTRLLHRWDKQRSKDLMVEIREAERKRDEARLARLLEEKTRLSRKLCTGVPAARS